MKNATFAPMNAEVLKANILEIRKGRKALDELANAVSISAVWHAAEATGSSQITPLRQLYSALGRKGIQQTDDQRALAAYAKAMLFGLKIEPEAEKITEQVGYSGKDKSKRKLSSRFDGETGFLAFRASKAKPAAGDKPKVNLATIAKLPEKVAAELVRLRENETEAAAINKFNEEAAAAILAAALEIAGLEKLAELADMKRAELAAAGASRRDQPAAGETSTTITEAAAAALRGDDDAKTA